MAQAGAIEASAGSGAAQRSVSAQSRRALDWLNFFKADAQTTVGPYLAIFLLAARHWNVARIGMVMALPGLVAVLTQTPAGALVDWLAQKRALVAGAAVGLGAGCLLLIGCTSVAAVAMAQGLIALATVVMPPAIAAISVGLVGPAAFARRMGRNEAYSHAGAIAYSFATVGLFYFAAAMSVAGAIAAWCIRPEEIDPALAREAALGRGG